MARSVSGLILPGQARLITLALILFIPILTAGCLRVPQQPDENYPVAWPTQFSSLGPKCQALNGSYMNKGVVSSKNEPAREVLLSNLLLKFDPESQAAIVAADALSLRADVGFAFTTLYITSGEQQIEVPRTCVCYKETLLVSAVDVTNWGLPYVGIGGSQTNAWLTKANDGSLIVLIEGNTSGYALMVPYYFQGSTTWGRFQPADLTHVSNSALRLKHEQGASVAPF